IKIPRLASLHGCKGHSMKHNRPEVFEEVACDDFPVARHVLTQTQHRSPARDHLRYSARVVAMVPRTIGMKLYHDACAAFALPGKAKVAILSRARFLGDLVIPVGDS